MGRGCLEKRKLLCSYCSCSKNKMMEVAEGEGGRDQNTSNRRRETSRGKLISKCLPKLFPTRYVILALVVLSLCQNVPNASSQPLLNQLAVLLRARPPWPTSFPATASPDQKQQQQLQQQPQFSNNLQMNQLQHPQFIQASSMTQPVQVQPQQQQQQHLANNNDNVINNNNNNVNSNNNNNNGFPNSAEQMQNFMQNNNNLIVPHLNQGIPVVAMNPAQNSITIMTPSGPDHIMPPNSPSGASGIDAGNNVFVAQPMPMDINNNNNNNNNIKNATLTFGTYTGNNAVNNMGPVPMQTNNIPPGTIVQVMPSLDNQNNAIETSGMFSPAGIQIIPPPQQHPQPPSAPGNTLVGVQGGPSGPMNFSPPQEQHQMPQLQQPQQQQQQQSQPQSVSQPFPGGFLMNPPPVSSINNNNIGGIPQPPPPPPIPRNFKGPGIIAVPKQMPHAPAPPPPPPPAPVLLQQGPFNMAPLDSGLQNIINNSPPQIPQSGPSSGGTVLSQQPIIIRSMHQIPNLSPAFPQLIPQQPLHQQQQQPQMYAPEHMISLPENAMVELNKTNPQMSPRHETLHIMRAVPIKLSAKIIDVPSHSELSSEMVGNPRLQRKRQQRVRPELTTPVQSPMQQYHQITRGGRLRITENIHKPTVRPTQIPIPASIELSSENLQNEIDIGVTPSLSDYSLSTIINMPSTTITGSFEYPDPPTPPNYQSMNILKYPSPYQDSAEVGVKNVINRHPRVNSATFSASTSTFSTASPLPTTQATQRKRMRGGSTPSYLHSSSPAIQNLIKRKRLRSTTTMGTTTRTGTSADSSSMYRMITTASAIPASSVSSSMHDSGRRETTTVFIPTSSAISSSSMSSRLDRPIRRKVKTHLSAGKRKDFRPSPQIHSFEEPTTGIKSYITIMPPVTRGSDESGSDNAEIITGVRRDSRGKKSLFEGYSGGSDSKHPPYEQGFKPVPHYTTYPGGSVMPAATTTTESMYFDLVREAVSKAPNAAWSEPDLTAFGEDHRARGENFVTTMDGLTVSASSSPFSNKNRNEEEYGYTTITSDPSTDAFVKAGWKIKDHAGRSGDDNGKRRQLSTTSSSSSERVEDWRFPDTTDGRDTSKIYFGNGKFGPPNCDKFHRFGFCPMNSGYPTNQVEKIASRCSALLSHLIAPLPKADVRYDVIVARNGSMLKGRSAAPSGWSWKSFSGKPVCDTKEIKVVPGWAKNEQGEWLVILQTKAWKQEAQITLCTPQGTQIDNCKGKKDCTPVNIKCVQRFTAQRLAVLDPENTDRCPVLRSVFLPSACVCLHDESLPVTSTTSSSFLLPSPTSASTSSSEEIASSSNASTVKVTKGSKGSKGKSSKGKSSKGKKSSKKSKVTGRTSRTSSSSSEEDHKNKSADMLDTAADSSTYGHTHRRHQHLGHFHNEDDSPEEAVGNTSARPRSETQLKKKSGEEVDDDDGEHGGEQSSRQNELEDDNNENSTKTSNATAIPNTSAEKSTVNSTSPPDTTEDEGKVTTVSPTESSEEERDGNFEEKKARAAEEEED